MSAKPSTPTTLPKGAGGWAGEIWGGFASMLVALPASIAYGVAVYGLLGADYIVLGVRAGILGVESRRNHCPEESEATWRVRLTEVLPFTGPVGG